MVRRDHDWKDIARRVCEQHNKMGAAYVFEGRIDPFGPKNKAVNLSKDGTLFVHKGSVLLPKALRSWLWDHRKDRAFLRNPFLLWSFYNEEDKESVVGVANLASLMASERLERMRRNHATIGV